MILLDIYRKSGYALKKIWLFFLETQHNRIILCGLVVGLYYYLFSWLKAVILFLISGMTFPLLTVTAAYLALQELWLRKHQLAKLNPAAIQRRLGHSLILFGTALFPFTINKGWSQALVWAVILVGILLSNWGLEFFKKYKITFFLIVISIYPGIYFLPEYIWRALTPERTMDYIQAWSVNLALQAIGYPSSVDGTLVKLPTGSIEIGWGCNGFDLIVLMLMTGLLIGIAYKLKGLQIINICFLGSIVAFAFNTARIVLLAISVAYWDESVFDFWHNGWGGQIFSAAMFTAYYYLLMQMRLLDFAPKSKLNH